MPLSDDPIVDYVRGGISWEVSLKALDYAKDPGPWLLDIIKQMRHSLAKAGFKESDVIRLYLDSNPRGIDHA